MGPVAMIHTSDTAGSRRGGGGGAVRGATHARGSFMVMGEILALGR
jgi:hypothetical protein